MRSWRDTNILEIVKLIEKGLRSAEKGDFVPHAEMKKLIARMRRAK